MAQKAIPVLVTGATGNTNRGVASALARRGARGEGPSSADAPEPLAPCTGRGRP
jgi:hypothetical protein